MTLKQYRHLPRSASLPGQTLLTPAAWDALRTDSADTPFSIPSDRAQWLTKAMSNAEVQPRAAAIVGTARSIPVASVMSLGVGGAWLEYHIKRLAPDLRLVVADYAPVGVARLREVFTECDSVTQFDLLESEWHQDGALVLLHRVDTEFDNATWRRVFSRMAESGVRWVLFVPSEFLTFREAFRNCLNRLKARIRDRRLVFCGWLRGRHDFHILWRDNYVLEREMPIGELTGFLLRLNSKNSP